MARLPDKSSRLLLISTFIICSLFLFADFRFGIFKPVQNFYNSSSLFIQVFSREYVVNPIFNSFSSILVNKRSNDENQRLKEELNNLLIENYVISNREILNSNVFFDEFDIKNTLSKLLPAKVVDFDVNQYLCCDKHRMFLLTESTRELDSFKVVINNEGIVGQTIKINKSLVEVILLSDKSHRLPIQNQSGFFCEANGAGVPKKIFCDVDLTLDEKEFFLKQKFFSSGMGGIFPKGVEIGSIHEILELSQKEIRLIIELKADPLSSNFFGIIQ